MVVVAGPAMVAQDPHPLGGCRVIRHDCASLAKSSQIFAGIETEAPGISQAARTTAIVLRAVRLGRIFHHNESVRLGNLQNRFHVGHPTKQVDRNNRLGPRGDRPLQRARIHRVARLVDIDKHGTRAGADDGFHGCDKRHGHGDDLIAGTHAK